MRLTDAQMGRVEEKRIVLLRKYNTLVALQKTAMPGIEQVRNPLHGEPEHFNIALPSALTKESLDKPGVQAVARLEKKMRFAQMYESLVKLRRHLNYRARLRVNKFKSFSSQTVLKNSRGLHEGNEAKIRAVTERYRNARKAMLALDDSNAWQVEYRELRQEDIRCMQQEKADEEPDKNGSVPDPRAAATTITVPERPQHTPREATRTVSWIWMTPGIADDDTANHQGVIIMKLPLVLRCY
jgi:hypothetical protein